MTPEVFFARTLRLPCPQSALGDCWIWKGYRDKGGYCRPWFEGKPRFAHRIAWRLLSGEWPLRGTMVCHRCDVRACVNPAHLFLGTPRDNVRDCMNKGRFRPLVSKLTDVQVLEIRRLAGTVSQQELAKRYGVTPSCINHILAGRSRAWLATA